MICPSFPSKISIGYSKGAYGFQCSGFPIELFSLNLIFGFIAGKPIRIIVTSKCSFAIMTLSSKEGIYGTFSNAFIGIIQSYEIAIFLAWGG